VGGEPGCSAKVTTPPVCALPEFPVLFDEAQAAITNKAATAVPTASARRCLLKVTP
jgi:hypothetical protein